MSSINFLLFELQTKEGQKYRLHLDGRVEGFPESVLVINHAFPFFSRLQALLREKDLPTTDISDE